MHAEELSVKEAHTTRAIMIGQNEGSNATRGHMHVARGRGDGCVCVCVCANVCAVGEDRRRMGDLGLCV